MLLREKEYQHGANIPHKYEALYCSHRCWPDAPVVPCPTPATLFSERWYCDADTTLNIKANGNYTDNIPIIMTIRGTWFSNNTDVIVFDDAGDKGSDARAYGMTISGKTMKVSLKSAGRGPNEAAMELHMIFTKQK